MSAISYANSFASNTTAIGSQVLANFTAVSNVVNGNLDQTNFTTLTGPISWSVVTNVLAVSVSSSSTAGLASLSATGVMAAATSIFRLTSNAAQTTGDAGAYADFTHASSTIPLVKLAHAGTGPLLDLTQSGTMASGKAALQLVASGPNTVSNAVVEVDATHASSTVPLLQMKNAGTGDFLKLQDNSANTKYEIDSNGSLVAAAEPPSGNLLYNGGFDLWQRGTSVSPAIGTSFYMADRWFMKNNVTGGGATFAQVAAANAGSGFGASVKVTSGGSAGSPELYQVLENFDTLRVYNKTCSFSALIKAQGNVTQVGLQFVYATSETKPTSLTIGSETLVTITSAGWTLCKILGQALGTAMTTAGVVGIRLRPTAVSSGNVYDVNNGILVEQAMMNVGNIPGNFQRRFMSHAAELAACQRFCCKFAGTRFANGFFDSTTAVKALLVFPVQMRAAPNLALAFSTATGTNLLIDRPATSTAAGTGTLSYAGTTTLATQMSCTSASASTAGFPTMIGIVDSTIICADADI